MRPLNCPECRASLDTDAIESTGVWECPYCGKPLPEVQEEPDSVGSHDKTDVVASGLDTSDSPPADSRIEIHEASDERLVVFVPPGGKGASGMGCFVLFWNLFMVVFTTIWLSAGPMDAAPLAFIGLFWLVGIGLFLGWVKLKYERTLLLVEPTRVVVQHILFGRKKQKETELLSNSRATLVEAYSQNEVPVYSVAIDGKDRKIRFGTSLSNGEKDWLVDRINLLLGPNDPTVVAIDSVDANGPAAAANEEVDPASLGELPEAIHIVEDDADRLLFWLPPVTMPAIRWGVMLVGGVISLIGLSSVAGMAAGAFAAANPNFRIMEVLFFIPFGAAGLMPLAMSLFAWRGRISVEIDREQVSSRWHVGPLGVRRAMLLTDVVDVCLMDPSDDTNRPRNARRATGGVPKCCLVRSKVGTKFLVLTFFQDEQVIKHVTALVKRKWQLLRPENTSATMANDQ